MKKCLSFLLCALTLALILCILPRQAEAAGGTCGDDLTWQLDDAGTLTISGTGAMKDYSSVSPWYSNRNSIKSVIIQSGVTAIGEYAFYKCTNLTSVTIPDSVISIGKNAFYHCESLTAVTIPDSVTTVGAEAFHNCYCLTSVTIGDSVTAISTGTFSYCTSLTSVTIGNSVTNIAAKAFQHCENLASVTIPDSVTAIRDYAFYECYLLTSVTIPGSVTTIQGYAFASCYLLKNVYYAADSAKWQAIKISANNAPLTNATIHYNHIHDYSLFPPVTVAATCTQNGYADYTCAFGETHRQVLQKLGHDPIPGDTVVAPTCEAQGYTVTACARCGEAGQTDLVPALGHDYTGPETVIAPTCTEDGYTRAACTRCSSVEEKNTVPALGHKMVPVPAVAPTCTKTGLTQGTACQRCQFTGVAQTEVPATGHSFSQGTCTVCGAPECEPGDLDGVAGVNEDDAIHLLRHVLMPSLFPVEQDVDYTGDGKLNEDDAIHLLRHVLMPNLFPL